jgi:hypothetical protein
MELILSVNAAITLMLLVVQMLDDIVEGGRPPLAEGHLSAFLYGPPGAAAHPLDEPAVRYDRAA